MRKHEALCPITQQCELLQISSRKGGIKSSRHPPPEEYDGYHMDGMAISPRPQLTSVHVSPSHLSASLSLKWLNSWWMNDSFAVPHSLKSEDITARTHKTHTHTNNRAKLMEIRYFIFYRTSRRTFDYI